MKILSRTIRASGFLAIGFADSGYDLGALDDLE